MENNWFFPDFNSIYILTPFSPCQHISTRRSPHPPASFSNLLYPSQTTAIRHYLGAYLEAGGFPETIGLDDFGRKQVLISLYNDILARDISFRYGASFEITDRMQVHAYESGCFLLKQ